MTPEAQARKHPIAQLYTAGWVAQDAKWMDLGVALGVPVHELQGKTAPRRVSGPPLHRARSKTNGFLRAQATNPQRGCLIGRIEAKSHTRLIGVTH